MDWSWEGDESDEESKLRAETRKIMELPDLPISATCVRVPVMIGHSEAVWIELEEPLSPEHAARILRDAPSVRVLDLPSFPTPGAGGRRRRGARRPYPAGRGHRERPRALPLCDNLRKGAALNAIQIADVLLAGARADAGTIAARRGHRASEAGLARATTHPYRRDVAPPFSAQAHSRSGPGSPAPTGRRDPRSRTRGPLAITGPPAGDGSGTRRRERLLHDPQHARATPLLDGSEPAELEPAELDTALRGA